MVSDWEISLNESQVCASLFTKVAGLCGPFVAIMDPTRHRYCNYTQTARLMMLRAKWIIPCGFVCGGCFSCLKCPLSLCRPLLLLAALRGATKLAQALKTNHSPSTFTSQHSSSKSFNKVKTRFKMMPIKSANHGMSAV